MWNDIPKERRQGLVKLLKHKATSLTAKCFAIKELFGIDVTKRDGNEERFSNLVLASKPYLVKDLLEIGYPLNYNLLMIYGCTRKRLKLIKLLVEYNKAEFNKEYMGWYPLDLAVRYGSKQVVEYLLEHGADPNVRSHSQVPVISVAAKLNKKEIVELLLKAGADPFLEDLLYKKSIYALALRRSKKGKYPNYTISKSIRKMIISHVRKSMKIKKKGGDQRCGRPYRRKGGKS